MESGNPPGPGMALLMITVMLVIMTLILWPVGQYWLLRMDATTIQGEVTGTAEYMISRSDSNPNDEIHEVQYRFKVGDVFHTGASDVTESLMSSFERGDPITVYYDPIAPDRSTVGHSRSGFVVTATLVLGLGFIWAVGRGARWKAATAA